MVSRRTVLRTLSLGLVPAGCLSTERRSTPSGESTTTTGTTSDSPSATESAAETVTNTPLAISDAEAAERAEQAESKYVIGQLANADCLEGWSEYGPTASDESTVRERTAEGVVVDVRESFSYWTADIDADAVVEATYLVTTAEERRIEGRDVDPC